MRPIVRWFALTALCLPFAQARAQAPAAQEPPRRVRVVAGPQYEAGALHKLVLGAAYRQLWTEPIEVEVLDLSREAGGLEPAFRVGNLQTLGLAMRGADGRSYTFRSVDKDLTRVLPAELRDTPVADIARDQVAASFPGGSVLAVALARAAGVLETQPRLVVMPDDPRLGEFRAEFAGLLGTFFEYPSATDGSRAGTFAAEEILDGREIFTRITEDPHARIDARAFLRARLIDLFLGDWDRHAGQWRWARLPSEDAWQPISEDRDQAFSRYEGLAMAAARDREPKFDRFRATYQGLEGLTWNARTLDRRFLSGLQWSDWAAVAAEIQTALDDDTIDTAIARLAPEYRDLVAGDLRRKLRARRDALANEARRFYAYLARQVDVRATNAADRILVVREPGATTIRISHGPTTGCTAGSEPGAPWLERRFTADETAQIRLYTGNGDDRVLLRGNVTAIELKIVGGTGNNVLCDLDSGRTHRFDAASIGGGSGRRVAHRLWLAPGEPIESTGTPADRQGPAKSARRDWGSTSYSAPWFGFGPDLGIFIGFGFTHETFGFRQHPYAAQHRIRAGFAEEAGRPRVDYAGDFRVENRTHYFTVQALASGIETLNYFGFGNETENTDDDEFHRVQHAALGIEARIVRPVGTTLRLSTGPVASYRTSELQSDRLIGRERPYGSRNFGQLGWVAGLSFNNRGGAGVRDIKGSDDVLRWGPSPVGRGFTFDADLHYYPELWSLQDSYATAGATFTAATWLPNQGIGLALRAGGQKNWGDYPFYDAAFIGGPQVRGLRRNRYAGDAAAYGNVTLLARVGALTLVVPGRWGVFARLDMGRVWLQGEDSDTWHRGIGGGLWWAPWDLTSALRLHVADSDDGVAVYVLFGFGF